MSRLTAHQVRMGSTGLPYIHMVQDVAIFLLVCITGQRLSSPHWWGITWEVTLPPTSRISDQRGTLLPPQIARYVGTTPSQYSYVSAKSSHTIELAIRDNTAGLLELKIIVFLKLTCGWTRALEPHNLLCLFSWHSCCLRDVRNIHVTGGTLVFLCKKFP